MKSDPNLVYLWVIYDHPVDIPDRWVVRRQAIGPGGSIQIFPQVWLAFSLDQAREWIASLAPGSTNLGRYADDDPKIAEVWI